MQRLSGYSGGSRCPAPAGGSLRPPPSQGGEGGTAIPAIDLDRGQGIQPPDGQARGIYRVRYGLVGLRRRTPGGRYVLVRLLYPGEIFCVCSAAVENATVAQAITPSGACPVHDDDGGGADIESLVAILQHEVELTEQRIIELTSLTAREILARHLLEFSWLQSAPAGQDPGAFRIPLARRELAEIMGIRPESLARLLTRFVSGGLIALAGRQARILDRAAMRRIAGITEDDDKSRGRKLTGVMESIMTTP